MKTLVKIVCLLIFTLLCLPKAGAATTGSFSYLGNTRTIVLDRTVSTDDGFTITSSVVNNVVNVQFEKLYDTGAEIWQISFADAYAASAPLTARQYTGVESIPFEEGVQYTIPGFSLIYKSPILNYSVGVATIVGYFNISEISFSTSGSLESINMNYFFEQFRPLDEYVSYSPQKIMQGSLFVNSNIPETSSTLLVLLSTCALFFTRKR